MWVNVLLFVVGLITAAYFYMTRKFGTFKAHGIPEYEPSFPFGSPQTKEMFTGQRNFARMLEKMYHDTKDKKLAGYFQFGDPTLVINDLELAKQMFIKDFDHFVDRREFKGGHEYLDNMMIFYEGEQWKEMRSIMSPISTSGKLKGMNKLLNKVGKDFAAHVEKLAQGREEVNARDLSSRYTMQVIANAGFGMDISGFADDPASKEFFKHARKLVGADAGAVEMLKTLLSFLLPSVFQLLRLEPDNKDSLIYFGEVVKQTMNSRKGNSQKRNDMVDLLMDSLKGEDSGNEAVAKQVEKELNVAKPTKVSQIPKDKIEVVLIAQLLLLFFAGMDTSSTIMSVVIYALAKNPDVQERLFDEINDALAQSSDGELDYNTIQTLPYMDMVINEALRVFPLGDHERKCVKEYTVPGTTFTVPKGMMVQVPSSGIMTDDQYFPNPDHFNPENFSKEEKDRRHPYAFMAFGIGPRNCIGSRLALFNMKSGLVALVSEYKVLSCAKTPEKLIVDPTSQNTDVKGGIWVKFERRN